MPPSRSQPRHREDPTAKSPEGIQATLPLTIKEEDQPPGRVLSSINKADGQETMDDHHDENLNEDIKSEDLQYGNNKDEEDNEARDEDLREGPTQLGTPIEDAISGNAMGTPRKGGGRNESSSQAKSPRCHSSPVGEPGELQTSDDDLHLRPKSETNSPQSSDEDTESSNIPQGYVTPEDDTDFDPHGTGGHASDGDDDLSSGLKLETCEAKFRTRRDRSDSQTGDCEFEQKLERSPSSSEDGGNGTHQISGGHERPSSPVGSPLTEISTPSSQWSDPESEGSDTAESHSKSSSQVESREIRIHNCDEERTEAVRICSHCGMMTTGIHKPETCPDLPRLCQYCPEEEPSSQRKQFFTDFQLRCHSKDVHSKEDIDAKYQPWGLDEDLKLVSLWTSGCRKWAHVANEFPGRIPVACRNRCSSMEIGIFRVFTIKADASKPTFNIYEGLATCCHTITKQLATSWQKRLALRHSDICNIEDMGQIGKPYESHCGSAS